MAALGLCVLVVLTALPAFAAELYEDSSTGQIFTKPGPGRTPVALPAEKVGGLYEDESGVVYAKPGSGRTPVAVAEAAPKGEEAQAADYSSQSFSEAVKHVISDEDATTFPKVKLGTLFYGEYFYDLDNQTNSSLADNKALGARNKFTLNRGYINLRAEVTPEIKVRVTPDITRINDANSKNNGDWTMRLKFGYLDFHNFLDAYPSLEVKMGQFETAWLDYEEGLWKYRVLDTMLIEKEGFMNSADLGVGVKGKIPGNYGDWQVDAINGEGYHADENNKYKTLQARLTLTPLPGSDYTKGLHLTGFYSTGKEDRFHARDRYIAFLGYTYLDDLFVGAEYDWTRGKDKFLSAEKTNKPSATGLNDIEGAGYSLLAWARMPFWKPVRILGRFDQFNHNEDASDTTVNRFIYGVSYDIGKNVMFVVDNERTQTDNVLRGKKYFDENLLKADVQWNFN